MTVAKVRRKLLRVVPLGLLRRRLNLGVRARLINLVQSWRAWGMGGMVALVAAVFFWWSPRPSPEHPNTVARTELAEQRQAEAQQQQNEKLDQILKGADELHRRQKLDGSVIVTFSETQGELVEKGYAERDQASLDRAEKLRKQIAEYRESVDLTHLSDEDRNRVSIAEARVALAQGRYRDALQMTSSDEITIDLFDQAVTTEYARQGLRVRADAFFWRDAWRDALPLYERLRKLEQNDLAVALREADVLYYLHRLDDSIIAYDRILNQINPRKWGRSQLVATVLANRSGALAEQGAFDSAEKDIRRSVAIFMRLAATEQNLQHLFDLAHCLVRRGGIRADQGKLKIALVDYNDAVRVYKRLMDLGLVANDHPSYAQALQHRATVYFQLRDNDRAVDDLDSAIETLAARIEAESAIQLVDELSDYQELRSAIRAGAVPVPIIRK